MRSYESDNGKNLRELKNNISNTIEYFNGNKTLDELKSDGFYDDFKLIYPKTPNRKILRGTLFSEGREIIALGRTDEHEPWTIANFYTNKFIANEDLFKDLGLIFKETEKKEIHFNSNLEMLGGEIVTVIYIYKYHPRINKNISVDFEVDSECFSKQDVFPRMISSILVYKQ